MERGVKHVRVHRAVDKLRLFVKNNKFHLFIGIIFFDDEQVNPKSRASKVLAQELAFKSDTKGSRWLFQSSRRIEFHGGIRPYL
ncbi:hypothetical protein F2Q70_00021753 [Brassica cretica]|uniref:Uncharacterized protein n=1 Tax=Brassica cretica TaxID=69181 RepID=A0A8S9GTF0_BRACR|nr:hypothetical protein F2Q70_00021753 [Brassica cretica]KAF2565681.1 hypothetical protein F2Q68_00024906 [Brassica cretica]